MSGYELTMRGVLDLPCALVAHRAARGLSRRAVARAAGLSDVTLMNIENGKDYTVDSLLAVLAYLADAQGDFDPPDPCPRQAAEDRRFLSDVCRDYLVRGGPGWTEEIVSRLANARAAARAEARTDTTEGENRE